MLQRPIDVANGTSIQDIDALSNALGGGLNLTYLEFGKKISRVHEEGGCCGMRPQFTEQPQPLRLHFGNKRADTREVGTGTTEAGDEAAFDRVGATREHDWYDRGRRLGRQGWWLATHCDNDGHLPTHEITGEPRQSIVLALSPTIVDGDVLTLDKA